jgi:hypothetical protein
MPNLLIKLLMNLLFLINSLVVDFFTIPGWNWRCWSADASWLVDILVSSVPSVCRHDTCPTCASHSEDEKKIRQADARAVRIIKDKSRNRVHPYKTSAKPTAMETAPNPYYSSNYKRQNRTFDSYSLTVVQPPVEVSAMRISLLRPFTFPTKFETSWITWDSESGANFKSYATRRKESLDLVDTFELFKVYFDNKLGDLKSELIQEQDSLTKKLKEDVSLKFKHEGNNPPNLKQVELRETRKAERISKVFKLRNDFFIKFMLNTI